MKISDKINRYFSLLAKLPKSTKVSTMKGQPVDLVLAFTECLLTMRAQTQLKNKIMFIGNGASAAISSHMASDYTKAGGMRSVCFNDGASLTCLANDFSYEEVFAKQVGYHGMEGDILIAISSSGRSKNILNAVEIAKKKGCFVFTFSGMQPDNPLRKMGDINFYVKSMSYGLVEITHHALLHSMLDMSTGWEK